MSLQRTIGLVKFNWDYPERSMEMTSVMLTEKELLVLASCIHEGSFYGVKNPFIGKKPVDVKQEIAEIKALCEKKGFATMGFDDTFVIQEEVLEILSIFAKCQSYVVIDVASQGMQKPSILFYRKEDEWVSLIKEEGKEECSLQLRSMEEVYQMALEVVEQAGIETSHTHSVTLSQEMLKKASECEGEQIAEMLEKDGVPVAMANIIVAGLKKQCKSLSIAQVDMEHQKLRDLSFIVAPEGCVRMQLVRKEEERLCQFSYMTLEEAAAILQTVLQTAVEV